MPLIDCEINLMKTGSANYVKYKADRTTIFCNY